MWGRLILFLIINFGALTIGALATTPGVTSEWYAELNKAPWTPPGWVFGFAWTTIMLCYSFFLAYIWGSIKSKVSFVTMYIVQLVLNILWNPIFFLYHETSIGLLVIFTLTILISYWFFKYLKHKETWLLLPYVIWLFIATSLNAYVVLMN